MFCSNEKLFQQKLTSCYRKKIHFEVNLFDIFFVIFPQKIEGGGKEKRAQFRTVSCGPLTAAHAN